MEMQRMGNYFLFMCIILLISVVTPLIWLIQVSHTLEVHVCSYLPRQRLCAYRLLSALASYIEIQRLMWVLDKMPEVPAG
jgi:hypothetical protein